MLFWSKSKRQNQGFIRFYLLKLIMYLNLQEQGARTFYFYYVLYGIKQEYKEKA